MTLHRARRKRALLLATASLLAIGVASTGALADGGAGGLPGSGGAGGVDSATGPGGAGGSPCYPCADDGGGGGGAGVTGGAGGSGTSDGSGGAGGNGGDGGAHGSVGAALPGSVSVGGNGGNGENSPGSYGAGGGGGAGGYGAVVTGSGNLGTLTSNVTGGNGGAGGSASTYYVGGNGGSGGIGLLLTNTATFTINAAVTGGVGGVGGGGEVSAAPGAGGAGIVGAGLTITMGASGSVRGGLSGGGVQANAITFTGGANTLTFLGTTSGLNGNIAVTGSLDFAQSGNDVTVSNAITGSGNVSKSGTATVVFSGVNTYTGATNVNSGVLMAAFPGAFSSASAFTIASGAILDLNGWNETIGSLSGAGTVTSNGPFPATLTAGADNTSTTFSGTINDGAGGISLTKIGTGTLTLSGANTYSGGTTVNGGTLQGTTTSLQGNITDNAAVAFNQATNGTYAGVMSGTGSLTVTGGGTITLSGANTYSGGTTVNGGTLQGTTTSLQGNITDNAAVVFNQATNGTYAGVTSGTGSLTVTGGGTITLSGANTYSGGTTVSAGTLQGTTTSLQGNITDNAAVVFNQATNGTYARVMSGTGGLTVTGGGTITLSGTNTYSGGTTVNGGTLEVDGSIASSSSVTVNSGATLSGTGIVDPATTTIMSGGTLAPGNAASSTGTLIITGNLAFQSGALYLIQVTPSAAASTNVTGTATLGGAAVNANFASGSYVAKQYTILTAGNVSGTFGSVANTNLPSGFHTSLSYDSTHAYLDLALNFVPPPGSGLSGNQRNVGNAIINFFNTNGSIPLVFGGMTPAGLTQLSGEAATGAQQAAFEFMGQFLNLMLDPFVDGRGGAGPGGPALGFAPDREALPEDLALAYAKAINAPVTKAPSVVFEPRWSTWASGFGGANHTAGDASLGSHDLSASVAGGAAGADYHLTRDSVLGFALAGGGTQWDLAQGLGGGRSDAFSAGLYGATRSGPAYLAASFAVANQWMSTDRFAALGDHLTANFNGESIGGRVEGGYRFGGAAWGITPYAALQAQSLHTPTYSETDLSGGGFGLTYDARTATDTRSELGARFDRVVLTSPDAVLTFRGRIAWAHDWITDPTLAAVFQALPGASFTVNGATPATDSALISAGAELRLSSGITLLGTFSGEFAGREQTYAGTGTIRYAF
jgi:autotransporter-associated beta strand protein